MARREQKSNIFLTEQKFKSNIICKGALQQVNIKERSNKTVTALVSFATDITDVAQEFRIQT